jgi:hypothetical protein
MDAVSPYFGLILKKIRKLICMLLMKVGKYETSRKILLVGAILSHVDKAVRRKVVTKLNCSFRESAQITNVHCLQLTIVLFSDVQPVY